MCFLLRWKYELWPTLSECKCITFPVVINSSEASHLSCGRMFSNSQAADLFSTTSTESYFIWWYKESSLDSLVENVSVPVMSFSLHVSFWSNCCSYCLYQVETGWCNSALKALWIQKRFTESCCVLYWAFTITGQKVAFHARNGTGSITVRPTELRGPFMYNCAQPKVKRSKNIDGLTVVVCLKSTILYYVWENDGRQKSLKQHSKSRWKVCRHTEGQHILLYPFVCWISYEKVCTLFDAFLWFQLVN